MSRIQVLLVDDESDFRQRLRNRFEADPGFDIVGEASNGPEGLTLAEERHPDVIVLDMSMPGEFDGVEVVRRLNARGSESRILALSQHHSETYIYRVFDEGASGYLLKDESLDTIADGVCGVFHGEECWFSPRIRAKLALRHIKVSYQRRPTTQDPPLGPREAQTLKLLAKGLNNWKIARLMDIAENTVKNHLNKIYQKLGVGGRGEAIVWALQHGYEDPPQHPAPKSSGSEVAETADSLEEGLARLARLLETRDIVYLLAGDIAIARSAGRTAGEHMALVLSRDSLSQVPEIEVQGFDRDWTRARLGPLQIDLLLPGDPVLELLVSGHATVLRLGTCDLCCVSEEGQILLKLSMLPRLYRQVHFAKVALWESDLATLIFDHRQSPESLLAELSSCLPAEDLLLVTEALSQIETRIRWFRSGKPG